MSFEECYKKVMSYEGRGELSNNPNDRGKETFSGISRRYWPDWEGWSYIDGMRGHDNFPAVLKSDEVLEHLVQEFYKKNFYDAVGGDLLSPVLASEMLEMAVNIGVLTSVVILQEALNLLNLNGNFWPDIKVDGAIGPATKKAISACLAHPRRGEGVLVRLVNCLQAEHYLNICRHDKSQETFLVGWLSRT